MKKFLSPSFFVLTSIMLTIAGCGGGGGSSVSSGGASPTATLQSIAVTPATPVFAMGKTQQFVATGTYSDGSTQNITSTVTWSSTTPTVASIDTSGLATGVAAGSSVIAATSGTITVSTTSTIYDPGMFSAAASLAHPRYMHTATLLPNGKVLVVGDGGGTLLSSSTELYDPATNTWASAGNTINTYYWGHSATLLPNGKVLVAGGYGTAGQIGANAIWRELANAELYDPATNTWTAAASMANPRQYHTATLLPNGKVLVSGGKNLFGTSLLVPVNYLTSAELYDPATNTWTPASAMATAREFHTATLLTNGKVLIAGGEGFGGLTGAELYDPAANAWTAAGSITLDYAQTATLLSNGKVLVAGGADVSATSMPYANLYDPTTNTWSAAGKLTTARSLHTAVLLPNGRVLVAGGADKGHYNPTTVYASAELYDPATNAWYAAGNLVTGRYAHTATLLSNGKVLVAGGSVVGGMAAILTAAELY